MKKMNTQIKWLLFIFAVLALPSVATEFNQTNYYNELGQISDIEFNSSSTQTDTVSYQYSLDSSISSVKYNQEKIKCVTQYNHAGLPTQFDYGCNGDIVEYYTVDTLGRLNSQTLHKSNSSETWYSSYAPRYDVSGYLTNFSVSSPPLNIEASTGEQTLENISYKYSYDKIGQLEKFERNLESVNYQYDAQGNLIQHGNIGGMVELTTAHYPDGFHRDGVKYDASGRIVEDEGYSYFYDHSGRLKLIRDKTTLQIVEAYRYDANGKRVSLYSGLFEEVRFNQIRPNGTVLQTSKQSFDAIKNGQVSPDQQIKYVTMGDTRVFTVTSTLADDANSFETTKEFSFVDRLSNPVLRWDESSERLKITEYSPYGQQLVTNFEEGHRGEFGFTGKHSDDDTGLIYMQARYQDPISGQFLTTDKEKAFDSTRPHSYNLYQYAYNNPVNLLDPDGNEPMTIGAATMLILKVKDVGDAVATVVDTAHTAYLREKMYGDGMEWLAKEGAQKAISTATEKVVFGSAGRFARNLKGATKGLLAGGKKAFDKVKKRLSRVCCFAAGTVVLTEQGHKPIEDIRVGDLVLSKNVETGAVEYKPVTKTFVINDRPIYELTVSDLAGNTYVIETTPEHPFFTLDGEWKSTSELSIGDVIESDTGNSTVVSLELIKEHEITYNFTVADFHTYYVTEYNILTHNTGNGDCQKASDLPVVKRGTKEWTKTVKKMKEMGKERLNVRTETATDAKDLLKEGRGNMDRRKNYTDENYKKGYEAHNSQNARELGAGNDLQHLKWKDHKSGGHIYYDSPN